MIDALYAAASGLSAQERSINVIASNLANTNTTGYKRSQVQFREIVTRLEAASGVDKPVQSGGVAVSSVVRSFSAGEMKQTNRVLDLAIHGDGFFEIELPDGSLGYTRIGALSIDSEGMLVTQDGNALTSAIRIQGGDAAELVVSPDGKVSSKDAQGQSVEEGMINVVRFNNPEGLRSVGTGVYVATEKSGEPEQVRLGVGDAGAISQGFLEVSNVNMVDELSDLMLAQRAMEVNSRVVQVSQEILTLITDLRK